MKMDYQSNLFQTIGKGKMEFIVLGLEDGAYMEVLSMHKI